MSILSFFVIAIAREQSIVRAAESLHLSQPTLSTQIKAMEEELGKQLLIRGTKGSRKVTLTEEGMILRKRAEEILNLYSFSRVPVPDLKFGYHVMRSNSELPGYDRFDLRRATSPIIALPYPFFCTDQSTKRIVQNGVLSQNKL